MHLLQLISSEAQYMDHTVAASTRTNLQHSTAQCFYVVTHHPHKVKSMARLTITSRGGGYVVENTH